MIIKKFNLQQSNKQEFLVNGNNSNNIKNAKFKVRLT